MIEAEKVAAGLAVGVLPVHGPRAQGLNRSVWLDNT